jgi:tetratricopeptide (TPR) repeat protein
MIQRAAEMESPFAVDYQLTLNFAYLFFEGRFEDGLAGAEELLDRYPNHIRTLIGLSVGSLFSPSHYAESDARFKRLMTGINGGDHRDIDWTALNAVSAYRAYTARYLGNPALAEARFRSIIHESPDHPDWAVSFARVMLAGIYASDGRVDDARVMCEFVVDDKRNDRFHKQARNMLNDLDRHEKREMNSSEPPNGLWIETLYRSVPDSLPALTQRFDKRASESLPFAFYAGESRWLGGDYEAALRYYSSVLEWDAPAWQDTYKMIAAARIAEIHAFTGDYPLAAEYEDRALEHYQNEYRVDWMLEGRKRYFERLAEGKEALPHPALLIRSH